MSKLNGPCQRLTIYIGESDTSDHKPLATEIVQLAHASGMAGITVLRGVIGYGASNHIHSTRILSLSADLPVVIELVDEREKIQYFILEIGQLVEKGLVTVEDVQVICNAGNHPTDSP
jgi:PII-like signaling protein